MTVDCRSYFKCCACSTVAAAADEGDLAARDAEDEGPPEVDKDWRAFRSRLMAGSGVLEDM